jgi:hypothetical protein
MPTEGPGKSDDAEGDRPSSPDPVEPGTDPVQTRAQDAELVGSSSGAGAIVTVRDDGVQQAMERASRSKSSDKLGAAMGFSAALSRDQRREIEALKAAVGSERDARHRVEIEVATLRQALRVARRQNVASHVLELLAGACIGAGLGLLWAESTRVVGSVFVGVGLLLAWIGYQVLAKEDP